MDMIMILIWSTSLIVVWFSVPYVIGSVYGEVGSINVVSLHCCFEQLRVVNCTVLKEVKLLVLHHKCLTFMLTPQILSSSASTFKS